MIESRHILDILTRRRVAVAVLAGFALAASGSLAQTSSVTTNTYDANSTSEDIRVSCKDLSVNSQGTLSAKCNKQNDSTAPQAVSAVSTTISMSTYVNCRSNGRGGYRPQWGAAVSEAQTVDPVIVLNSTGSTYYYGAYCLVGSQKTGPSGPDIGDTTNGLKNNGGSLAKR